MSKIIRQSIVKSSKNIRTFLQQRMEELNLTPAAVVKDAQERGRKIDSASLSKYLHNPDSVGGLPEETITWVAERWGINLYLNVTMPPYNEENALKRLKIIFG